METFTKRQQEIINAAIKLISEKGIQQLTIKNLSGEIGIAEGGIYRHFKSKIDILLAILVSFENRIGAVAKKLESTDNSDALTKLETTFDEAFKNFKANPVLAAVIFSEEIFQNDKRLSNKVFGIMKQNQETIQSIIKSGQQSQCIRSDISNIQLALIIMGALRLMVTQWRLSGFAFDLESEGRQLWSSIRRILAD
ncbi:MAG: TetR/AcrR family transcriptional regulator [Candidatus Krumholzibacteriota bacterium]|nr:TetR/AcrR family transcriptional regulator [Candidatus Krumholzibacteriota bacterium]